MAIGYLIIQARSAHDAIPLSGVRVRIQDDRGNSVYELTTDENGETPTVPLETLDKRFSQTPYYPGTPYTSYHVLAQAEGFNSLFITAIPILDGETAILPLALVPMSEFQRFPTLTRITVGKPAVATQGTPHTIEYVVRAGDSLWLIAQRYRTTVDAVKRLNGLTGDLLHIGQVLLIPAG